MNVHITANVEITYTKTEIGLTLSSVKGTLREDRSDNSSVTRFLF